jgi:glycosyltransferase involved in cell wall biosynthesis
MNPHYIVLAGWFWFLCKKQIFFWRNHARMNVMTRVAAFFSHSVFYTSPYACTKIFPHSVQMPVGIDTTVFTQQETLQRNDHSVLFLGRISPVKCVDLFVDAIQGLTHFDVHVYGDESKGHGEYRRSLEHRGKGYVTFHGAVPNYATPAIYSAFDIYVNLTPEGSMDKTVLEAAACGALVIVANKSFTGILPDVSLLSENTPESLRAHIQKFGKMTHAEKQEYRTHTRQMIERDHSLKKLATALTTHFSL